MSVSMSSLHDSCPLLSVFSTLPEAEPSDVGNVYVTPPSETVESNVAAPVIRSAVPEMPPATSSFVCGVVFPIPTSPPVRTVR